MTQARIRPLPILPALVLFGVPTMVEYLATWHLLPLLDRAGYSMLMQFAAFASPLLLIFGATFIFYHLEGNPWKWTAFRDRLRLGPLSRRLWIWSIGLALVNVALYIGAAYGVDALFPSSPFPYAVKKMLGDSQAFLGYPLKGAWWLLFVWFMFYLLNVLGEEFWWRGMILPRQELSHGSWTWAIHGTLWAGFHLGFYLTDFLVLLPGALAYAWVCQRCKSTVPGLVAHGVLNGLAAIRIVMGILG
jgi:membrane protease YdiL (CAAX protease family)